MKKSTNSGNMLMKQKMPAPKITKQVTRPAKPSGEGMGMQKGGETGKGKIGNLGKWAHPPAKKKG